MRLSELAAGLPDVRLHGDGEVGGLSLDSRTVSPGDLFAALPGRRADGRRYAAEAAARGASAILASPPRPPGWPEDRPWVEADRPRRALAELSRRFFERPDERLLVAGITGTDGKTTTAWLARAALERSGIAAACGGTLGFRFGDETLPSALTTPEAPDLFAMLARAAESGARAAVIEVSSAAVEAERVAGLRFAAALLTNLGRDHLDLHGDAERYAAAKARLFGMLPEPAAALLPADDPSFERFARAAARRRIVTFGTSPSADWRVADHEASPAGARFRLTGPGLDTEVRTSRPAPWDAANLAAAVALAVELGADPSAAVAGAAEADSPPGRWQVIAGGEPFLAVVDYAHTPEALTRALELMRRLVSGSVIVVFGCGGERDRTKRGPMGEAAGRLADRVIVTDDNPRREDPESIAADVLAGIRRARPLRARSVERVADRAEAIARAVELALPGDGLLVAGKGHERYQEIGDERRPFDDRAELRAALAARGVAR
ncbi:MAG: UDP-N-acetylmuramoyl-L-alanyl-D-glutamate--2,6-diaminopimelate ligase [Acidobacteria bacterium]|nr:MAG: UDP-N-acetylmuramoyl-L-alanyl-D-glutamate--2,6-diaminopimelate ligase [Acidobacteriota bacterium]